MSIPMAGRHRRSVVAAVAAALLLMAQPAVAVPGALDPSFSGDGRTVTPYDPFILEEGQDAVVQPDGKIVVVGWSEDIDTFEIETRVVRYLSNGTPDAGFGGGDGIVVLPIPVDATGSSVALLSDQRIVVAGNVRVASSDWDLAAFLLTTTGELDTSFHTDGVSVVRFGDLHEIAFGVDVDTADRIVLGGRAETANGMRMAVARLTSDGIADPSFSVDGKTTVSFPGQAQARDVDITPSGKIVLAGRRQGGGFAIARLSGAGTLDPGFSGDGRVVTGTVFGANAVTLQPDGKILAAGFGLGASVDFMLVRYRINGSRDTTFHRDGIVRTNFQGLEDIAWDVEVQPNGRIIAIGHVEVNGRLRFGVVRYRPSGIRDLTFSGDGKAAQLVGTAFGSTLDATPRLIVVGTIAGNIATARYLLA